jgi:hypothetical protein
MASLPGPPEGRRLLCSPPVTLASKPDVVHFHVITYHHTYIRPIYTLGKFIWVYNNSQHPRHSAATKFPTGNSLCTLAEYIFITVIYIPTLMGISVKVVRLHGRPLTTFLLSAYTLHIDVY